MKSNFSTDDQAVQNKRDLVETLLKKKASQPQLFASSFSQQRLWLLDQLEPNNTAYLITKAIWLGGDLCARSLAHSLQEIVHRHAPLRTTFQAQDGQPVQVIAPKLEVVLPIVDLSDLPTVEREARAQQWVDEEAKRSFNLAQGPLFRAYLLKLAEQEHVLVLSMHHIVSDGWSLGVLFRELSTLYDAFLAGLPSPLPELPIQYADYAVWQRERLQGDFLETQLTYWKQKLAGAPDLLALPTDRPRPSMQTFRGATEEFLFSRPLADAVKALAQREGMTLFMVLLAAFQVLLLRHTGQEDIVVGSPIAGRTQKETEGLIGFFANTLALRTDLSGDPTFRELLGRVKETCLGAYEHQELPFEKIVEELAPERSLSYNPLVQILLGVHSTSQPSLLLNSVSAISRDAHSLGAGHDITITITDSVGGLELTISYSTDLFEAPTIARLLSHYRTLLEGVVASPEAHLSALPLLTEAERHQLLVEFNDTAADYPKDKCLHQLFEEQVERSPDAVAVVFENERLTYGELNARANQLAHHLRKLGVGPDVLVGICVERSLEMIIGLLGILKAGGAYVPLDPSYPKERLAFMLEDAAPAVLLTQEGLLEQLPKPTVPFVFLEDRLSELHLPLNSEVTVLNLAYVMYTSGSTGMPKAVEVSHQNVVRLVKEVDYAALDENEVLLQFAPLAFDASTFEIWGSLLNGARLVICRPGSLSLEELGGVVREWGITTLWLTAGLLRLMVDERLEDLQGVRQLLAGGDVLPMPQVRRVLKELPKCRLINGYGPTECTTFSCCYSTSGMSQFLPTVPIGRPISNTQCYVLDGNTEPVPLGVAGELCIAGAGVARGYLNRPELTAEKFLPNPFSSDPLSRLYKTGDLVRWRAGGNLEFLGRLDHQVKIRGFRIELGEVEAALLQHSDVKEAVVVVREDVPGDKRLAAYVVPQGEASPSSADLRLFLKERLPEYMTPSGFMMLEKLPLTGNGKIDRWGLPAMNMDALSRGTEYVEPRTAEEEILCGIWGEVLGVERVGIYDNFFDLGGHSLLATQVISRIRKTLNIDLSLLVIFQNLTISSLAKVMTRQEVVYSPHIVSVPRSVRHTRPT